MKKGDRIERVIDLIISADSLNAKAKEQQSNYQQLALVRHALNTRGQFQNIYTFSNCLGFSAIEIFKFSNQCIA